MNKNFAVSLFERNNAPDIEDAGSSTPSPFLLSSRLDSMSLLLNIEDKWVYRSAVLYFRTRSKLFLKDDAIFEVQNIPFVYKTAMLSHKKLKLNINEKALVRLGCDSNRDSHTTFTRYFVSTILSFFTYDDQHLCLIRVHKKVKPVDASTISHAYCDGSIDHPEDKIMIIHFGQIEAPVFTAHEKFFSKIYMYWNNKHCNGRVLMGNFNEIYLA